MATFDLIFNLQKLFHTAPRGQVVLTDLKFPASYYFTFSVAYALSSIFISCKYFFGEPIVCEDSTGNSQMATMLKNWCWFNGRYTHGDGELYNSFYQLLSLYMLCFLTFILLPKWLWKIYENGSISYIVNRLDDSREAPGTNVDEDTTPAAVLQNTVTGLKLKGFYLFYLIVQIINLCNIICSMWLIDWSLNGHYWIYGLKVFSYHLLTPAEERQKLQVTTQKYIPKLYKHITKYGPNTGPMIKAFPRIIECTYERKGVTGVTEELNTQCLLLCNNINDKIFLILWILHVMFAIGFVIYIIYHIVLFFCPRLRTRRLINFRPYYIDTAFTDSKLLNHISPDMWFILTVLKQNIDPETFKEVLLNITTESFTIN
jgi:hypothetical protein